MSIKLPDKWKKILSKIASKDKLLIFLLAGVLLIIINIPVKSSTAKAKNSDTTVKETQADSSYYISALEKELSQALAECEGVGRAKKVKTAANNRKSVKKRVFLLKQIYFLMVRHYGKQSSKTAPMM